MPRSTLRLNINGREVTNPLIKAVVAAGLFGFLTALLATIVFVVLPLVGIVVGLAVGAIAVAALAGGTVAAVAFAAGGKPELPADRDSGRPSRLEAGGKDVPGA